MQGQCCVGSYWALPLFSIVRLSHGTSRFDIIPMEISQEEINCTKSADNGRTDLEICITHRFIAESLHDP